MNHATKWIKRILFLCIVLFIAGTAFYFYAPKLNDFQVTGSLQLPGLSDPVTVSRDEKGMAYITARNQDDLWMAQGFVTAQDRLFQMQVTRLFAQGRISELAGDEGIDSDIRYRTIGLHRMAKEHAAILDRPVRNFLQAYVNGVNAFIDNCPEDIHLEFKLAGISPEKWEIADSLTLLYFMGYSTAANMEAEIISQMLLNTLGHEKALTLLPVNINPDDYSDTGQLPLINEASAVPVPLDTSRLLAYTRGRALHTSSNNWVTGPGPAKTDLPVLAGDPHMDTRILPGVWYPVGLECPGIHAVGANIAGLPGMAIGRTGSVAFAMTNSYGDIQDLYIETPDPENPDHYIEGLTSVPFEIIRETMKIKDKKSKSGFRTEPVTIRTTRRGPVLSGFHPGLDSEEVTTFRFAPAESMTPEIGLLQMLSASDAHELDNALKKVSMLCLNWVFADTKGNIGYRASGKIPVRHNGDGIFPHRVTGSLDNWYGFIPDDQMPHSMNPDKKWIGTSNHKTIPHDYPYYYSSYAAPTYRYRRVRELMISYPEKTGDAFFGFQKDNKNLMAADIAPVMAKVLLANEDTRVLGKILSDWNFRDHRDLAAPAVFHQVYDLFAWKVFQDDLGHDNARIFLSSWYYWQERLGQMILEDSSPWFDDITTDRIETRDDLIHAAGLAAMEKLTALLGDNPKTWQWGKIHTLTLTSPLRRKGPGASLLGTGAMPSGGSGETLNRANYEYNDPFKVTFSDSLRMVTDLSDQDKIIGIIPGGVTGRVFHPHQKDQVDPFMKGEKRYWWFSPEKVKEHEQSRLELTP